MKLTGKIACQLFSCPCNLPVSEEGRICQMNQKNHKILIADDDPDDRLLITEVLRDCHREIGIDIVADVDQLQEYLCGQMGRGLPNLILMGICMPRGDGLEVLREIKTDHRLRAIPVVVLTGLARDTDIYRAYEIGANTVVEKPYSLGELSSIVRRVYNYWLGSPLAVPPCSRS
jgi:CheY-like chemotaxis protein